MVDLKGNTRHLLSGEWEGAQGLAWSVDGHEIWFTATNTTESHRDLYAVSRSGRQRLVLRAPGGVWLEDIAPDGRVLLARQNRRYEVFASRPGDPSKQIGWVEVMIASSLSHNGQFAVIGDWGSNRDYDVYLVNLDGSPPILLGHGVSGGISPDNKKVTSILPTDTSKILLLPTGPGETRTVGAPGFQYRSAKWTRDGQQLVVRASQMGRPTRMWLQDLNGSAPQPITPEATEGLYVAVNHSEYVSARSSAGKSELLPIRGGTTIQVRGITESDEIIGGSSNSQNLYVTSDDAGFPRNVAKLNFVTGERRPLFAIAPADPAGIVGISAPLIADDEKTYVYGQLRTLSVLYIATGLK